MISYFDVLGITEDADAQAVSSAFAYLADTLHPDHFPENSEEKKQAARILSRVTEAHTALSDPALRAQHASKLKAGPDSFAIENLKPLFGHMCVSGGFITYKDLREAIDQQSSMNLALGQILQDKGLMTQTEIDGILMGQQLYGAPPRELPQIVRRFLALALVDIDMVKIALIDQYRSSDSLDKLLLKRGFVYPEIFKILSEQPAGTTWLLSAE